MVTDLFECDTASQWCQRWASGRPTWSHADPLARFDARAYEVHELPGDRLAQTFVTEHHYSGTYPSASRRYGLYRAGVLVGVAVYSIPVQAAVLAGPLPDLEPYVESLELGRFVLGDQEPGNAESWFLARCHSQLYAAGVRGVVAFSDPVPRQVAGRRVLRGHVGFIYQASNARYAGRSTARTLTVLPDGSVLNDRTRQKILTRDRGHEYAERQLVALGARAPRVGEQPGVWLQEALNQVGATRLRHGGCHRYVFPLGRNARDRQRIRIGLPAGPYPKRVDG